MIRILVILPALIVLGCQPAASGVASTNSDCATSVGAAAGTGVFTQVGSHACVASDNGASASHNPKPSQIRWIDCGAREVGETSTSPGGPCVQVAAACAGRPPATKQKTTMVAQVVQEANGSQRLISIVCDAPVGGAAAVTAAAVRAQAQRLVPHPAIGVAPPGGVSLVNIQTVLWVDTGADRDLGAVTLLGQRVSLRVHVQRVEWQFGDGQRTSSNTRGRPYDPADPCRRAVCPNYGGHVYTATGPKTISAQVIWTGEFRVGSGGWQSIQGTVTGPRQSTTVTIREARGVLVPNDTGR